jgi:predicted HD phosphohydrolase
VINDVSEPRPEVGRSIFPSPTMNPSVESTVDQLFSMLESNGSIQYTIFGSVSYVMPRQGDYIGEAISQLEHCLQAAQLAREAGTFARSTAIFFTHGITIIRLERRR